MHTSILKQANETNKKDPANFAVSVVTTHG